MARQSFIARSLMVACCVSFQLLCAHDVVGQAANQTPLQPQAETRQLQVPTFEYQKGQLPRATGGTETRRFEVSSLSAKERREATVFRKPFSFLEPWRPFRYFGPFRSGSDLGRIQMYLHGQRATWYYNDFFSTFASDDPAHLNVFRAYYRRDLALDPWSSGTLPTTTVSAWNQNVRALTAQELVGGFAWDILLTLREVTYSSRYGGSLCYRFDFSDVNIPSRGTLEAENFGYEFGRNGTTGQPSWRFDLSGLTVRIYVVPSPALINPKTNVSFKSPSIAMEFEFGSYVAYRDGFAVPSSEGAMALDEIVDVVRRSAAANLMQGNRPEISLFTHAWIHDQHYGLIGENNKVARLAIADGWADPVTDRYRPVAFVQWKTTGIEDNRNHGLVDAEGAPEWSLRLRSFVAVGSDLVRIHESSWDLDENEASPFTVAAAFYADNSECSQYSELTLRLRLRESDPVRDDAFDILQLPLLVDCASINSLVPNTSAWPTVLSAAVLPKTNSDVTVALCDSPQGETPVLSFPGMVCVSADGLQGTADFFVQGAADSAATMRWRARVTIEAR